MRLRVKRQYSSLLSSYFHLRSISLGSQRSFVQELLSPRIISRIRESRTREIADLFERFFGTSHLRVRFYNLQVRKVELCVEIVENGGSGI